jgi:c-di-GMP-binding flagellar brake protein YcgR
MIGLLRSTLSVRRQAPGKRQEPGTGTGFGYVTLNNPVTILRLLNQLHFSRSKVLLHAENEAGVHSFHSTIARVQRRERGIVLHRPEPRDWQRVVAPGTIVEVICFLTSGQLSFFSQLWPLDDAGESQYCTLTLPPEVSKFQLRSAYRVFLPPGSSTALLTLQDSDGKPLQCETSVLDLSLQGCALRLNAEVLPLLSQQALLPEVQFSLLNGSLQFSSDLRLCRSSATRMGQVLAGGQFLPLPEPLARRLQALLAEVQRQHLRQQLQIF